ncbi:BNC1 [Cordylochernes scorpioides]|uniref:BNC1 n=1 Tax=Cordylochernes scorpioides TaxID=51811 RepID=A0ABY6K5L2_9ARAC|nr:BNC1 [Cordylochernes scorpioides]
MRGNVSSQEPLACLTHCVEIIYVPGLSSFHPTAVAKLGGGFRRLLGGSPDTGPAYDVAALILYGAQALPIRLKILLDRLLGGLRHEDVLGLLAAFGWTYEDYVRGYIAQGPAGQVLDRWSLVGRDEEPVILQEFLRFGETKAIAHQLLGGEASMLPGDYRVSKPSPEPPAKPPPAAFSVAQLTAVSDPSATDEDDAINLSQRPDGISASSLGTLDSVYAARKVRHLRKSANPMKRRCNPQILSTMATNPSTGKKRVQCLQCFKTFCDKGALKIHFSAVHLREMHKCTVVGCNMMFSSRRSRNRHSANPNPKLHTPNIRRKMNPHDGRTALPYPVFPPPTAGALLSYNNNLLHGSPYLGDIKVDSVSSTTSSTEETPMPYMTSTPTSQVGPEDSKKLRLSSDDGEENGMNLSTKPNRGGVSRRKSFNPTKCAVSVQSDEDLQYISTDDTSSDTCNDFLSKTEEEEEEDDSELLSNDDSKDDDPDCYSMLSPPLSKSILYESCIKEERNFNLIAATKPRDFSVDSLDLSKKSTYSEVKKSSPPPTSTPQLPPPPPPPLPPTSSCTAEENPIRRLESLSMGTFSSTSVAENCSSLALSMPPSFSSSSSSGVSFHAPGLGLGSDTTVTTAALPSALSSAGINGDCSDLVPYFRDPSGGSHGGSMDIPVDRENPRRCTVCGKIFQNHFGVKTHYQNVHLKLMHKCTVEGCNAAFPSKRSRDRHSANLNLHRKLLSTSASDKLAAHFFDKSAAAALFAFSPHGPAGRAEELYTRMYDYAAELYHGYIPFGSAGYVGGPPASPATSSGTTPSPRPAPSLLEDTPTETPDGCHTCQLCHKKFHEPLVLREHYEKFHLADLYRCPAENCSRLYLSRKARDACCHPK